jgi:hypothetical protein
MSDSHDRFSLCRQSLFNGDAECRRAAPPFVIQFIRAKAASAPHGKL